MHIIIYNINLLKQLYRRNILNDNELINWIMKKLKIIANSKEYYIPRITIKRLIIEINEIKKIKNDN